MKRKSLLQKLKLWWLSCQCPRFYEDMPKEDETGVWEAGCIVRSFWASREKGHQIVEGSLIDAYIKARQIALKEDRRISHCEEMGVDWFVKAIK